MLCIPSLVLNPEISFFSFKETQAPHCLSLPLDDFVIYTPQLPRGDGIA